MITALLCLATLAPAATPAAASADVAVVCPEAFHEALAPWLEYRREQGREIVVIPAEQSAEAIREDIRETAQGGALQFVVLIGDAEPAAATDPLVRARCVPTHLAEAEVNIAWGSEPELATDNWYADLDDDRLPDVALGRLPVDTPEELTSLVERIIAYEQTASSGTWRRQVNVIAGVGGFGSLVDGLLETATRRFLTDGIPAEYRTSVTYGSWQSPYCPDPREFRDATLERLNEGCLFWVYVGHGSPYGLDYIRVPGAALPIFEYHDTRRLRCEDGPPIALMLSCYTAAFDAADDCLAEQMLRTPGGPIAVVGGSRVCMPYALASMADGMLNEYFQHDTHTLGEVVLGAKRQMLATDDTSEFREMLDVVASALNPEEHDLVAERLEHVELINLLGDPLLTLNRPAVVTLEAPARTEAGSTLTLTGASPVEGQARVELVCRRDLFTFSPPHRREFHPTEAALSEYNATYRQANDDCWTSQTCPVVDGQFTAEITVPAECLGACHLRVFVEGDHACAMGASDIYVRRHRPEPEEE